MSQVAFYPATCGRSESVRQPLSDQAAWLLCHLWTEEPHSVSQLAKDMPVSRKIILPLADELRRAGFGVKMSVERGVHLLSLDRNGAKMAAREADRYYEKSADQMWLK